MAGDFIGRAVTLNIGGAPVATARTKNLTINNSAIDVTADDDAGVQALLNSPGQKSVEISVDGMFLSTDTTLVDLALNSDISASLELNYGSGLYKLSGTFVMTSYSEGQPYNEATTFSASFSSAGAVTKAAVA